MNTVSIRSMFAGAWERISSLKSLWILFWLILEIPKGPYDSARLRIGNILKFNSRAMTLPRMQPYFADKSFLEE